MKKITSTDRKVAIVTGGGSGIGLETANQLIRDGFTVATFGRRIARSKHRREDQLRSYVCDVSSEEQIRQSVNAVLADLNRIDVLVNAAGIIRPERISDITQEAIRSTLDINLIGTINMSLACLEALQDSSGVIVNLSSMAPVRPMEGSSIYGVSKGAIDAFTRALAVELGPYGVRVNAVSPALVRSELLVAAGMEQKAYNRLLKERGRTYPLNRVGEPEDVSQLISFLASDRARWMTGAIIPIDGGKGVA